MNAIIQPSLSRYVIGLLLFCMLGSVADAARINVTGRGICPSKTRHSAATASTDQRQEHRDDRLSTTPLRLSPGERSEAVPIGSIVDHRHSSWDSELGRQIEAGDATFAELEAIMLSKGESAQNSSGRQALLENIVNRYMDQT